MKYIYFLHKDSFFKRKHPYKLMRNLIIIFISLFYFNCNLQNTKKMQLTNFEEKEDSSPISENTQINYSMTNQTDMSTIEMNSSNKRRVFVIDDNTDFEKLMNDDKNSYPKRKRKACNKIKKCFSNCKSREYWLDNSFRHIKNSRSLCCRKYYKIINHYDTNSLKCYCGLCKKYNMIYNNMDVDEANTKRDRLLRDVYMIKNTVAGIIKLLASLFLCLKLLPIPNIYFFGGLIGCFANMVYHTGCNLRHYFCPSVWDDESSENSSIMDGNVDNILEMDLHVDNKDPYNITR